MPVALKRSLFIGLGGTGMKTILKTKKLYQDAFGEIPGPVAFLGIDTSSQQFSDLKKSEAGETVAFAQNEKVLIGVKDAPMYYMSHKDRFSWIPKNNVAALRDISASGAGQLRSNGRFALTMRYDEVKNAINNAVDRITNVNNADNQDWTIINDPKLRIYLIFSLSGGTGCGTFLNIAYLIKELCRDNCMLQAIAVMPGSYKGYGVNTGPNAYGAMLDTDYLMSCVDPENPFVFSLFQNDKEATERPFDLVTLVDNVNGNGDRFTEADDLYSLISKTLYAISGNLGAANDQSIDNFINRISAAEYDISDKKGWICGMGLCELFVNEKRFRQQYQLEASLHLASELIGQNDAAKTNDKAIEWIEQNNICEHEKNQLLDTLYDVEHKVKGPDIDVKKAIEAEQEAQTYISETRSLAKTEIDNYYEEHLNKVKEKFHEKLLAIISQEGGLAAAEAFIDSVLVAVNMYAKEMLDETSDLENSIKGNDSGSEKYYKEILDDWKNTTRISRKLKNYNISEDLNTALEEYIKNVIDEIRHKKAQEFYVALKEYAGSFLPKISSIKTRLGRDGVLGVLDKELTNLKLFSHDVAPYQIDLTKEYGEGRNGGDDVDCTVDGFAKYLSGSEIFSLADMSSAEIITKIKEYVSTILNTKVDDLSAETIILNLSNEEKGNLFTRAIRKADILLEVKEEGWQADSPYEDGIYISVPGGDDGSIAKDDTILNALQGVTGQRAPQFVAATTNKSILLFHQKGAFPVFQLPSVTRYKSDYERVGERRSLHFDANLETLLADLHFDFYPNKQKDDDVLEMWVKGLIWELIRRDGTRYLVHSPALCEGKAIGDEMYKLKAPAEGFGTEARAIAFDDFKTHKRSLMRKDDLLSEIKKIEQEKGRASVLAKYEELAKCSYEEYITKYSQISIVHVSTLDGIAYQRTKQLVYDEFKYVQNKLVKSLEVL